MKRFLLAVFLTSALMASAQTSMTPGMQNAPARKSPLAEYAGTWIGIFQGHTWMTVRLTQQGPILGGSLQRPRDLEFQDSGDLKSVSAERSNDSVDNAVIQGDGLLLTVKDPGTQETFRYVMRLTSANTAELKMVGMSMPPGMAKPKPWILSRLGPSAVTPVR